MGKSSRNTIDQRRKELLSFLSKTTYGTVDDFVEALQFSPATIRRDINQLLEDKQIVRSSKGRFSLMHDDPDYFDVDFFRRYARAHTEKVAIAKSAIELVQDGSSLGMDCGTTCLELSKLLLQRKNVSVVTNGLYIPRYLHQHDSLQLFCVGGFVDLQKYSTEGAAACAEAARHNFDITFFSIEGLDFHAGLTSNNRDTDTQLALIRQAAKRVLLIDSTKFGVRAAHNFLPLEEVDYIIVDDGIRPEDAAMLDKMNIPHCIAKT